MNGSELTGVRYRIGDFDFDPATGELRRAGAAIRLRPQSAATLLVLVERAGELVTRQELQARVWPDTVVEYDLGLNTCVRQLRGALGDHAESPSYIQTLPRRGYRLIAPVSVVPQGLEPLAARAPAPASPAGEPSRTKERRRWVPAVIAVVASLAALAATLVWRTTRATEYVAVLPFEVLAADSTIVPAATGLLDDIIAGLDGLYPAKLRVIGRRSSIAGELRELTPAESGRRLGARYVVEGSIRWNAGGYRVSARFLDAKRGVYLWARSYDGVADPDSPAPFDVGEQIAGEIRSSLGVASGAQPVGGSVLARDRLRRARWVLAAGTVAGIHRGAAFAAEAIAVDSMLGDAWLAAAEAAFRLGGPGRADSLLGIARARQADPAAADALAGAIALFGHGRPGDAVTPLEHSLARRPRNETRRLLALALAGTGKRRPAVALAREVVRGDPLSAVARLDMGWVFYYAGALGEADDACRSSLELDPEAITARTCVILVAAVQGRLASVAEEVGPLIAYLGGSQAEIDTVSRAVRGGNPEPLWRWLEGPDRAERMPPINQARVAVLAGHHETAVRRLEEAAADQPASTAFASVDPVFAPLCGRSDFALVAPGGVDCRRISR